MSDCGHRCCEIPTNLYHSHTSRPGDCDRSANAPGAVAHDVPEIVATVLHAFVPQIPHLPDGDQLDELVRTATVTAYRNAMTEPDVVQLPDGCRRHVIATRVGIALAFPL